MALDYKVGEAAGLVEAGDAMEQEGGVVRPHHSRCHGGLTHSLSLNGRCKVSAEIGPKFGKIWF